MTPISDKTSAIHGFPSRPWRVQLLVVVGCGIALWLAFRWYTGIVLEDALITFRYAENIALGRGFVYNAGEPVLGTSSPLVALLLAVTAKMTGTAAIPTNALVMMVTASAGTAILIASLVRRELHDGRVALFAAVLYCVHPTTLWTTVGGMETPLVLLLMCGSVHAVSTRRWYAAAVLCVLLLLSRPDAAVWVALVSGLALMRESPRRLALPALTGVALALAWGAYAAIQFGSPLPQSIGAKRLIAHGTGAGASARTYAAWGIEALGFDGFASGIWFVAVAVGSAAVLARWRITAFMPFVFLPPLLSSVYWIGRAPLEFPWYAAPITLCGVAIGTCGAAEAVRGWYRTARPGIPRALAGSASALLIGILAADLAARDAGQFRTDRESQENEDGLRRRVGEWLASTAAPNATVAVEAIGYIGAYSKLRVIDLAGLVSPDVVDSYRTTGSRGAAFEHILTTRRPDYLVLRSFEVDTNEAYHGGALFETTEQRETFARLYEEVARFDAPHPHAWGRLAHLTVYRLRAGSIVTKTS